MPPAGREPTSSAARRQAATLAVASGAIHLGALGVGLVTATGPPAAVVWQSYGLDASAAALGIALAASFGYVVFSSRRASSFWVFAPALIPALFGMVLFRMRLAQTSSVATKTEAAEAVARTVSEGVGHALVGLVLATFGAALALSCAATLLAGRARNRSASDRAGPLTMVAVLAMIAAFGSVAVSLRGPSALFAAAPMTFAIVALGIAGAAVERAPNRESGAFASADGVLACMSGIGAVLLGAFAYGSSNVAAEFQRAFAGGVTGSLLVVREGWSSGLDLMRRIGFLGLVLTAGAVLIFAKRAALVGIGARLRPFDLAACAIVALAAVGGARFELGHGAKSIAEHWSPRVIEGVELVKVQLNTGANEPGPADGVLVIGRTRVSQGERDLFDVRELDKTSCETLAARVERHPDRALVVAIDAAAPYARMACVERALSEVRTECRIDWLVLPEPPSEARIPPPLDKLRPFPGQIPSESAGHHGACKRPPGAPRLHLSGAGLTLERADRPAEHHEGSPEGLALWVRSALAGERVLVGAEPEVPASTVLFIAAAIRDARGQVLLERSEYTETAKKEPSPSAVVRFLPPKGTGNVDLDDVKTKVETTRGEVQDCYERARSKASALDLTLRVSIQVDGKVSGAESGTLNFAYPDLAACVIEVFKRLSFAPPTGGGATVFQSVSFTPGAAQRDSETDSETAGSEVEISFDKVTVAGKMMPSDVQSGVERLKAPIADCADRARGTIDGQVAVHFVIGRDGGVSAVSGDPGTELPSRVTNCIYTAFYQLGFPQPAANDVVKVVAGIHIKKIEP